MNTSARLSLAAFSFAALLFLAVPLVAQTSEEGFVSLFDGKTLDGWKIGDNAGIFSVQDGMIVMSDSTGHPGHLFYEGDYHQHTFKNFDLRVDVMTFPGANSGIYFHTLFQQSGFPGNGIECQVDNSHSDWRRTGSLYGIRELTWGPEKPGADNQEITTAFDTPPVKDNVWYTQEVICRNGLVTVLLDGKKMFDYQVPDPDHEHKLGGMTWQPEGTFALQGHPPMRNHISKVEFKNIRVKVLPD